VVALALAALVPLWPAPMPFLLGALAVFPGFAHVLSSGVVYLDPECRAVFRRRAVAFYVGPGLSLGLGVLLALTQPSWLYTALLLGALLHNTRQSTGILNLTRRLGGGSVTLRPFEERLVWAGNACCFAFMAQPQLPPLLVQPARVLTIGALVATVARYLQASRRARGAAREHQAFLFISATLSWPLVAVSEPLLAWALMTLPHQAQYLGVLWTSRSRRLVDAPWEPSTALLARLLRDAVFGIAMLGALSALVQFLGTGGPELLRRPAVAVVMGCTLAHYWIDAFLWRGRDPDVRALLLAYVVPRPREALG